jgi:hypothetical protein
VTGCRWKLPPLCLARPPSTPLRQPRAAELAMRGESYLGHSNRGSQRTTETAGAYPPVLLLMTYLIDTNRSRGIGLPPRFAGRIPQRAL